MLDHDAPEDRSSVTTNVFAIVDPSEDRDRVVHSVFPVDPVHVTCCDAPDPETTTLCGTDRWNDLMIAAQNGGDASYDTLMREVNQWLFRYFRRRLPREIAEDHCQETLLAIHIRKQSYVASGPFGPWLAAIARFKWMDHLRHQYREASFLPEEIDVEDHEHRALSAIVIDELLNGLKPSQASAIRLVKLAGASVEEAAAATGQSKSLIKVNVHRGLKEMANRLDGPLLDESSLGSD